jgi:hypothetical protein
MKGMDHKYKLRRSHMRLADSLNDRAVSIEDSAKRRLRTRAKLFVRSAWAYRLAGMAAAARVQLHNAAVTFSMIKDKQEAEWCRREKAKILTYQFEKEDV